MRIFESSARVAVEELTGNEDLTVPVGVELQPQ